jgi:hypothetical protein
MMLEQKEFDLGYRPKSYWGPQDLRTHYGARAKGELRREAGLALLDDGIADDGILTSSLSNAERSAAGAVHPWLMGGEYLPDYLTNEVEIARVTMKSTTMDVISVRARPTRQRIIYRVVDEYMDDFGDRFSVKPKTSKWPLSMGQLIQVIEANELVDVPRENNYEGGTYCSPDEIFDFCTVSSAFYPQLARWYDEANESWRQTELAKLLKNSGQL